jgi:hypothetical protein
MRSSPQLYVICILTLSPLTLPSTKCVGLPSCVHSAPSHSTHLIISCSLNQALSVSSLLSCPLYATYTHKTFWSRGCSIFGDREFKFLPETGHPDRAFSAEINVVIYFKSRHSRLVSHCSYTRILVDPAHYLRTLFPLFQCTVCTISGYLFIIIIFIIISFLTLFQSIVYCSAFLHYFNVLFTLFKCIVCTISVHCFLTLLPIETKCLYYLRSDSVVKFSSSKKWCIADPFIILVKITLVMIIPITFVKNFKICNA